VAQSGDRHHLSKKNCLKSPEWKIKNKKSKIFSLQEKKVLLGIHALELVFGSELN